MLGKKIVKLIVLLISILSCTMAFASPPDYMTAKDLADRHEKSLSSSQLQALTASQGAVGGKAMAECVAAVPAPQKSSFALVMQLDSAGKVKKTWLGQDSNIAKCFEEKMAKQSLNIPPFAPFYTVYEMTFR